MENKQAEVLNWVHLIAEATAPSSFSEFLFRWEKVIFTAFVVILISVFSIIVSKNIKMVPGRRQAFFEMLISGLDSIVESVIGARGRDYTPFVGSLFIYIFVSNLLGLIPLQNSIMSALTTTAPI